MILLNNSLSVTDLLGFTNLNFESVDGNLSGRTLLVGFSEIIFGKVSVLHVDGNFSVPVLDDLNLVLLGLGDSTFSSL